MRCPQGHITYMSRVRTKKVNVSNLRYCPECNKLYSWHWDINH